MLSLLPAIVSAAMVVHAGSLSDHTLLTSPTRHVRTTDGYVQGLLKTGLKRSPTFATLVRALEGTDVIVYIQAVNVLPADLAGRMLIMRDTGDQRYLRIQVTTGGAPADVIALIGHELRHALEVADASGVRDDATLAALYERIGERGSRKRFFDTAAARTAGDQVYRELLA